MHKKQKIIMAISGGINILSFLWLLLLFSGSQQLIDIHLSPSRIHILMLILSVLFILSYIICFSTLVYILKRHEDIPISSIKERQWK